MCETCNMHIKCWPGYLKEDRQLGAQMEENIKMDLRV